MIFQGLSDTLLGHPGRCGSPAACPELTRPTPKSNDIAAAEGWSFFMRLFKNKSEYQLSNSQLIGLYFIQWFCYTCFVYVFTVDKINGLLLCSVSLSLESGMNHTQIRVEQITSSSHFFPALTKRGHRLVFHFAHHALGSLRVTKSPDRLKLMLHNLFFKEGLSHLGQKRNWICSTWQITRLLFFIILESTLLLVFAKWKVQ